MAALNSLLSPISMAFIIIIIGYYVGRIKIFKVSLDLSAVLIIAVLAGWLLVVTTPWKAAVCINEYKSHMNFFSSLGTALFVSSIGISTGGIVDFSRRKELKAILIGSLMVISAFVAMRIISLVDKNITTSKLLGCLCGALTTTPGLSAACELENIIPEEVTLGYGCTYLFGVVATVLFIQIATRKSNAILKGKTQSNSQEGSKIALNGLVQIGASIIVGRLLGNIEIADFTLGNSGGMLCSGIIIGIIIKKFVPSISSTNKEIQLFRNMGLVLFFVGNGVTAGMKIYGEFDIKLILYGALMTIIPIVFGVVINKLVFRKASSSTIIAGGMTSTPAISILSGKNISVNLTRYTLTYFGALLTIVIIIKLWN